jgi:TolA-binding protein
MKSVRTLCAILLLVAGLVAQTSTKPKTSTKKAAESITAADVQALKDALAAQSAALAQQQQQIQELRDEVRRKDQVVQQAQTTANDAATKADAAQNTASQQQAAVSALKTDVDDVKGSVASTVVNLQETQKNFSESPVALRYKGVTITPGGFIAAETVTRQRANASSINTPFNSIPYPGNALAHINESDFTGRQSRLSLLAESKLGAAKLTGYWEADFLGTGVTSNNRQSNSYVMRQRVLFAQAALDSGWIFTGGQQWSLVTETRKGITNRTEVLPMSIDPQYVVGFGWARQYGFRVVKDFGGKFALGVAVEAPQSTIGGRGFSSVSTTNQGTASVTTIGNAFVNGPGSGGGLLNFSDTTGYSFSKSPDFIVKAVADPKWGHYEVYGIYSAFRNRVYPCAVVGTNATDTTPPATPTTIPCGIDGSTTPSALGAFNDTRSGGGIGANLRLPVGGKKAEFGLQGAYGDGIGRYASAQIADLTLRPDGTQALIRTGHALAEVVLHPNAKWDIYADFGGEYGWRTAFQGYNSISVVKTPAIPATATTAAIPATTTTAFKTNQIGGYGSLFANNSGCSSQAPPSNQLTPSGGGTCAGDTRIIMEGTLGFWNKLTQGPKGGLRWGIQYSYFTRNAWSGNGISPKAVDNMVWTSFRYYLP